MASLDTFLQRIHELHIEEWYESLKSLTFETKWIELSINDAKNFIYVFKAKQKGQTNFTQLQHLEARIDEAISQWKNGAFVKTSFRSPKDATLTGNKVLTLFNQQVQKQILDSNGKVIEYMKASGKALQVKSGKEALELLTASERIYEDMELTLESPKMKTCIILREWIDIPLEKEFRGFVYQGKLTALSQYFHPVHFQGLEKEKEAIYNQINEFYKKKVEPILTVKNCILDFAVPNENTVFVIELNPFNDYEGCGTDPCMFDWKKDFDVLCGKKDFEFRLRTIPNPNIDTIANECMKNLKL